MIADFAIVGAGIAGAGIAAELAPHASVVLLEGEAHPGYHATGRSAAFWEETYGGPAITPLTRRSLAYLEKGDFLRPRGALYIGQAEDRAALDRHIATYRPWNVELEQWGEPELKVRLPGLKSSWCAGVWQPDCRDIDVAALHEHYLARAKGCGATLLNDMRIAAIERRADGWMLTAANGRTVRTRKLIDAAGAWADDIACMAGVAPIGIEPYRRTIVQLRTRPAPPPDMPLVLDISGRFYFKPENGRIWLSPHDEVPSAPCDSAPDELAVARAIARFEQVMDWRVENVETRWSGLRSFAPDRLPVYGPEPDNPDFIWCAGQGGFGIQTAPAAASMLADMLIAGAGSVEVRAMDAKDYLPERFR